MRSLLSALVVLGMAGSAFGQACVASPTQTCTPNVSLALPVSNSPNWNIPLNQNFNLLDSLLSGGALIPKLAPANLNNVLFVDGVQYATVQAAINALPAAGGTVVVPAGTYSSASSIVFANGVTVRCAGPSATTLAYTGTGIALNMTGVTRATFQDCGLSTSSASAIGIKVYGLDNRIENFYLTGTAAKQLWVTGDGSANRSATTHIAHGRIDGFGLIGIQVDHAIDTHIDDVPVYPTANSTTAQPLVVDSGTSGLYISGMPTGWGLHGLTVQHSFGDTAPYGGAPIYLFFNQFLADTTTGGDAWLFASSLGANVVSAHFTSSWAAYAGHTSAGATTTAGANGVHISGGQGIYIGGGSRIRLNAGNGILIDNANVRQVTIDGDHITGNNTDNAADQHGVYITAAATDVAVMNSIVGNVLDTAGNQKYGVKIGAVAANEFRLIGNDLNSNVTGALSNSSTGNYFVLGNLPSSSPVPNTIWGPIATGVGSTLSQYNGISAVSNGIPVEYAAVDLTAQTAPVATTTLYAVPASGAGQYRVSWDAKVTTAATTSTLGALTITYTDLDGTVQTITAGGQASGGVYSNTNSANTTGTLLLGFPLLLNCKASTNIQYAFAYASNPANAMAYNLHIRLEAM